jgi:hypothetical protein
MATHGAAAEADASRRVNASSLAEPHYGITPTPTPIRSVESQPSDNSVETALLDLSGVSLSMLHLIDDTVLSSSVHLIMQQVDRPRANVGDSGPPGRVD